jgi:isocitrate dehydrogenase
VFFFRHREEYGSHDKTFVLPSAGTVRVVDKASGKEVFKHVVAAGDIWRMCQTKVCMQIF